MDVASVPVASASFLTWLEVTPVSQLVSVSVLVAFVAPSRCQPAARDFVSPEIGLPRTVSVVAWLQ